MQELGRKMSHDELSKDVVQNIMEHEGVGAQDVT